MRKFAAWSLGLALLANFAGADTTQAVVRRGDARFFERHADHLRRVEAGPVGLLFLGDSITEAWRRHPDLWEQTWGMWQPANFGTGGDRTQHVLWRITEGGSFDKIDPKGVVLLIGTNNSGEDNGPAIVAGVGKILEIIRDRWPEARVLVLGIFPRGPKDDTPEEASDSVARMAVIREANAGLALMTAERGGVRYLDLGHVFLAPDGTIPKEVMPDQLHLSAQGYEILANALRPAVAEMMEGAAIGDKN